MLIDAAKIAERLGNVRTQNMVILGAIVKTLGVQNLTGHISSRNFSPKDCMRSILWHLMQV